MQQNFLLDFLDIALLGHFYQKCSPQNFLGDLPKSVSSLQGLNLGHHLGRPTLGIIAFIGSLMHGPSGSLNKQGMQKIPFPSLANGSLELTSSSKN